jgi:hypothetical protein
MPATRSVVIGALDARVRIVAPEPVAVMYEDLFADLIVTDDQTCGVPEITWNLEANGAWKVSLGDGGSLVGDVANGLAESIIEINRLAAASVSAERTVLHAGAFEVGGAAIAVTGASGAGKSTVVAAAVLRGHGYLADEVCVVDPAANLVRPYYRPIGLRAGGAAAIGVSIPEKPRDAFLEVYPWMASRHGRLADATPLRLLAFVDRRPGPVELVPVDAAEALVRLTTLSLGTDGVERPMFRRLDQLVRDVSIVTVGYEDSFSAIDALADVVR